MLTKAPEIEKNWEKFQGDVASLEKSDDPTDEREALVLNATACIQFQQEGADLKNISDTVLFGDLQKGDADAFSILHNFRATIDQGNAALEHFLQANIELKSIAQFENNYVDEGFVPGTVLHPSDGGFKSADDVHADLAHINATTTERVNPNEPTTPPDLTSTRTNVSPH